MADSVISTKRCTKCEQILPHEAFTSDKRVPTGLKCYCRSCCTLDAQKRRALIPKTPRKKRAKKPVPDRDAKVCPKCKALLPLADFGKSTTRADGLKCWCKGCHNLASRARFAAMTDEDREKKVSGSRTWRRANPEKCTLFVGRWRRKNPDAAKAVSNTRRARVLSAEGKYTSNDVARIFAAQSGKCAYCRKSIKRGYQVDHIIPLAKGGSNWPKNLQLACSSCNQSKHARDPIEYAQGIGLLL